MSEQLSWSFKTFAQLSLEELYQLLQLRNEVFVVGQNCVYQDADGRDAAAIHLLGKWKEQIVAYCRIFPNGVEVPDMCNFGRVAVVPDLRGKGWGKELVRKAQQYLKTQWPEATTLIHAQSYLKDFYHFLGFEVCSDEYDEVGIPHLNMKWQHNSGKVAGSSK